jgi:hypothetical protein
MQHTAAFDQSIIEAADLCQAMKKQAEYIAITLCSRAVLSSPCSGSETLSFAEALTCFTLSAFGFMPPVKP